MSKSQDKVRKGFSLGVLIIGSLCWDCACHRKKWRDNRLNWDDKRSVRAPIRYGRLSKSGSWRDSYTMVFSSGLDADDYGHAIVAPCRQRGRNVVGVVDEAVLLWTAETREGKNPRGRVSAEYRWGYVGLLPNPKRPLPADLCAGWKQKTYGKQGYGRLKRTHDEVTAGDEYGSLTIPWPKSEDGSVWRSISWGIM